MNTDGSGFSVLHSFGNGTDGKWPNGSLTLVGTTLYGMTWAGGPSDYGTVFKIDTDGTDYSLLANGVGRPSYGSLAVIGSTLYGIAPLGGTYGYGSIFRVNTDGTGYSMVHAFRGDSIEGGSPCGSLVVSGSTLYGLSSYCPGTPALFRLNADGSDFTVLHNFSATEGVPEYGSMTLVDSTLYGIAARGGAVGCGSVFQISTNGTDLSVLHNFADAPTDGSWPYGSGLTLSGSKLYGVAVNGGSTDPAYSFSGNGVIFSYQLTLTPEPSSFVLSALGMAGLAAARRRRCGGGV
jgi:uncharacterized repeat protein (TIGR03803 family)